MDKKINKGKVLVPTMGITGVLVGIVPFISSCTLHFNPVEPEEEAEQEILIKNNATASQHIAIVNGTNYYNFGNFALDESVTPVENMFEISITVIGWEQIDLSGSFFSNNFADKKSDSIKFYLSAWPSWGWPVIANNWEIGEKHPLSITVKDNSGTLYYQNTGADDSKAFFIQRGE